MKKLFSLFALALVVQMANAQLIEPEYIGQAYALLPNGERIELQSEIGFVSVNSKAIRGEFSHSYTRANASISSELNVWRQIGRLSPASATINTLASATATTDGFSLSTTRGRSVNYLNVSGIASSVQLNVKKPLSIILRLENNEYLPETQMKVVRFEIKDGIRVAHAGSGVPFHAVETGKSSYQIILDKPFYGEYGVVFQNDMNTVLTFSLGYSDEDVCEYVKSFLEPGSVDMLRYTFDNSYEIFDAENGEYIEESDFVKKYGADFYKRVVAEYKKQQKAIAKAQKALRKAQRKAKKSR